MKNISYCIQNVAHLLRYFILLCLYGFDIYPTKWTLYKFWTKFNLSFKITIKLDLLGWPDLYSIVPPHVTQVSLYWVGDSCPKVGLQSEETQSSYMSWTIFWLFQILFSNLSKLYKIHLGMIGEKTAWSTKSSLASCPICLLSYSPWMT